MNSKLPHLLVTAVSALSVFADPPAAPAAAQAKVSARARMIEKNGGIVEKPNSSKGFVLVLDTQTAVQAEKIKPNVENFAKVARFRVDYEKADAASVADRDWKGVLSKKGATAAVIVVNDENTPSLLVSPDEMWAVVNVRRLGDKADTRVSKQVLRALALTCGAPSRFKSPLGGAYSVSDLDSRPDMLPMDQVQQVANSLQYHGMRNPERVSYRTACQQGWAPQPTNDVQKAIWEKVHELPTDPIKIKYDPKRDK